MTNELELITTDAPELIKAVSTASLEPTTGERLILGFAPFFRDAKAILDTSRTITVTDATQVTEINASRQNRLKLRAVRIAADKTRKTLKEDSQKLGNAIQSIYNLLALDIEKEENRLQDAEDFAERAEAERKEKLKQERTAALVNADALADLTGYDLGAMSDASFSNLLESTKMVVAARKAAAYKAESERIEAARIAAEELARKEAERQAELAEAQKKAAEAAAMAKAEREAREKVEAEAKAREAAATAEAKRLADVARAEQIKRDAEIIAERSRIKSESDAREKAERDAKLAAEAEAKKLRDAETARIAADAKAKSEREAAEKKAAQAPDKEKLLTFADSVAALTVPEVGTDAAKAVREEVTSKVRNFANWIRSQSANL